jgi:hypothetical protein
MAIAPLTQIVAKPTRTSTIFWLSLSLALAAIYGLLCLRQAFNGEYVVQDDARQHVFWMRRWLDPGLFPGDLIADYFQSVAPAGYSWIYRLPTLLLGIDPLVVGKLLPPLLGLMMTVYCFRVTMQIFPVPIAGFVAALLLNQTLWMKDGLASATPRAFAVPLLLAFADYLLRRSLLPCLIAIALLGLIYPHNVFIAGGILLLRLGRWEAGRLRWSTDRQDYRFCIAGLLVIGLVLLPYAVQSSQFGPTITIAAAKTLPEFFAKGRTPFFHDNPIEFWLDGRGSGYFPSSLPPLVLVGLLLPILLRLPQRFPLGQQVTGAIAFLPQMLLAATAMFFVAHALAFRLHLPNRYTGASTRIVIVLAAGVAIVIFLDGILRLAATWQKPWLAWLVTGLVAIGLIFYPAVLDEFPSSRFLRGEVPALYQFLARQPKDTLIASLSEEADNLPTFAQRATLAGREYGVPFQVGYYQQIRDRAKRMIAAQYSSTLTAAKALIADTGIDFWLLDRAAFTPQYITAHRWMRLFQPETTIALTQLQQGKTPAIAQLTQRCSAFETEQFVVLSVSCITRVPE